MKPIRLFFVIALLFFKTESTFAQLGSAVKVLADGAFAIAGSGHQKKQEKIIDQSTAQEKINGSNVAVLRVKESDIKSKAKSHIISLQNRLDQYSIQYKSNQPINIPKNDSDLIAIQNIDENWPAEDYMNELRAYKRYAFQQKQKTPAAPVDSLNMMQTNPVKKDTTNSKL